VWRVVLGVIGGGLLMAILVWGGLVIFFPTTTIDDAILYVDIGGVVGAVGGGVLASARSRPSRISSRPNSNSSP